MKRSEKLSWILLLTLMVITTFVMIWAFGPLYELPVYGEKLEEGIQVAHGEITDAHSKHGQDWIIRIENKEFAFQFEYGTFNLSNHPQVGDTITIAYEWQKLRYEESVSLEGNPNRLCYWAPVILSWDLRETSHDKIPRGSCR